MRGVDRDELRREWRRLQTVDAKVIELRRSRTPRGLIRWSALVESALERRASASAITPGAALRRARRKLGYRDLGRTLAMQTEIPVQTSLA